MFPGTESFSGLNT